MFSSLSLFSGIGAFDLGLERTGGFRTVAFCEIDQFARRVLAKHWPGTPCYDDVRTLTAARLHADSIFPDVICGGFPCTDISVAGKGAGITGEQSGLWSEFARLIGEVEPRYVIVENVAALLGRGLGDVLGDLASLGYDAEWHCIPASAIGAPHIRDRVWIVAHTEGGDDGRRDAGTLPRQAPQSGNGGCTDHVADTDCGRRREQGDVGEAAGAACTGQSGNGSAISDAGCAQWRRIPVASGCARRRDTEPGRDGGNWDVANTSGEGLPLAKSQSRNAGLLSEADIRFAAERCDWWATEPDVGRVVDGPAGKVDRRKRLIGLGNSLVPQIPELIGRAILRAVAAA